MFFVVFIQSEKSVGPDELFSAFDNTIIDNDREFGNNLTVYEFMTNWTTQSGYPVLNIAKNESTNTFTIVQVII